MFGDLILKKAKAKELTLEEYYEAVDYVLKNGVNPSSEKFFISLNSFGMTNRETLYLALAIRDSGKVLKYNQCILEKHSTGGVGDSTSVVLIPLLASLGYKVIKTTAKSFVFTNGSADRFGAIPGFSTKLSNEEIKNALDTTNACVLSHNGDICPADRILFDLREVCGLEQDIHLLAASIAAKKLASGAGVVLVDVKYGDASIIKDYKTAYKTAKLLKYIFDKSNVKSVIFISDTRQTIGEGIGNAIEVVDALNVLQGKKCLLRDVTTQFAVEMMCLANKRTTRKDALELVNASLDNGYAYNTFMDIIKAQGGKVKLVKDAKMFVPYKSVNFVSDRDGYVGNINSLMLGELIRRLCADSHDNNIGVALRVKIGDYIKKGDIIVSFYYKDDTDFEKYKKAITGCVRVTNTRIKPVKVIKKVIC